MTTNKPQPPSKGPQVKTKPNKTLYAFWSYNLYPYFLSGEVTDMRDNGAVETKEYGPGNWFGPVLLLPLNAGLELREKLKTLENDYREAERKLRKDFDGQLTIQAPELAKTRGKR